MAKSIKLEMVGHMGTMGNFVYINHSSHFIPLFSFIKRMVTNYTVQGHRATEIDRKLDRIIKLLEEKEDKP